MLWLLRDAAQKARDGSIMLYQTPQRAGRAQPRSRSAGANRVSGIVARLQQLGLCPVVQQSACGPAATGIGLSLSTGAADSCGMSLRWELARIRALLFERWQVTVSLQDTASHSARQLEQLLRQLRRASSAPCIDRRQLGLALSSQSLPLPAYLVMSRVWLGGGPRHVILDETRPPAAAIQRAVFSMLHQQRTRHRALNPVYGSGLRSRCPLLPDELGTVVVAPFGILAPAHSAWFPVTFNLCRFCDSRGRVRREQLLAALRRGLGLADALFDELYWVDSRQRQDARDNRRIAFLPEGVGDLLVLQRADPSAIACLRALDRLFADIHETLWEESRRLAESRGLLPALAACDVLQQLPASSDSVHAHWRQRWQQALASAAVRHRNLLVMSPYALLPQNGAPSTAFADLLPLLAYADAFCFAGRPTLAGWRIDDFRAFHQRAAAVMRRRNATSFVATGA